MQALARLAVRRPVAVAVFAAAVVILGVIAWRALPLDLLPDIQSPTVVVSMRSGDRPPVEMERIYGERVEQLLFTVRGIRAIDQTARTGRLIATVRFEWGADMDLALVDVEKAVGNLRADPEVDEVLVRRFDPRQTPILTLGLVAPGGSSGPRRVAEVVPTAGRHRAGAPGGRRRGSRARRTRPRGAGRGRPPPARGERDDPRRGRDAAAGGQRRHQRRHAGRGQPRLPGPRDLPLPPTRRTCERVVVRLRRGSEGTTDSAAGR